MRLALIVALALFGCSEKDGTSATDDPFDPTSNTNNNPDSGGSTGPQYMDPVAVGIEIDGVLYDDGTLHPLRYEDGSEGVPFVRLTFADEAYFGLDTAEAQVGHFCEVAASLVPGPSPSGLANQLFDNENGTTNNWSYEISDLLIDLEFVGTACQGVVDPAIYGVYGENLIQDFDGMHIGFGFGVMTDRLWEAYGGVDDPANVDLVDNLFSVYIAANDRDGHWGGCDWTVGRLFEVDANDMQVEDPKDPGFLLPVPVNNVGSGAYPKGYLRSFAYWYQDFPLMSQTAAAPWDFSHMGNDPVNGAPDCGDW